MPPTKMRFGIVVPNLGGFRGGISDGGVIVFVMNSITSNSCRVGWNVWLWTQEIKEKNLVTTTAHICLQNRCVFSLQTKLGFRLILNLNIR